ncbi:MAG TPA: nucleoid-structuring protein H-NS [Cyclobacteriaceae bacterium]|nr:nucleoid-structuring protein H-NS [Cyclobacteriaceae bacterium]
MKKLGNSLNLVLLVLILTISALGCQSKKKAMEATNLANEKARMEQEATQRKQQEAEAARKAAEEMERKKAEALKNEPAEVSTNTRVNNYFDAIANANTVSAANNSISEALNLFASPETPVLIVISEEGGQKDYDRPTTISEYLHYLKDQKKNNNVLSNLKMDNAGKITEVEIKKPL